MHYNELPDPQTKHYCSIIPITKHITWEGEAKQSIIKIDLDIKRNFACHWCTVKNSFSYTVISALGKEL